MPVPADHVGKYINFLLPPSVGYIAQMAPNLVNGALLNQTINSPGRLWHVPPAAPPTPPRMGAHRAPAPAPIMGGHRGRSGNFVLTGQSWPFTFLKYVPGRTTVVAMGNGLLTGPMSGCYLFRYTQAGVVMFAHVGTADDPGDPRSAQAKADWLTIISQPNTTDIQGGSPADYFTQGDVAAAMMSGNPMDVPICGYFTTTGAYAMLLSKVKISDNPPAPGLMKVAKVKQMTLQPWNTLKVMRKFSGEYAAVKDPNAFKLS